MIVWPASSVPQIEPGCTLSGEGLAADLILGQPKFNVNSPNEGAAVSRNSLWLPLGLRIDQYGALWVADSSNNRVLKWAPLPTVSNAAASLVVGQPGFVTNGAATTQTGLSDPRDIAIATCGNLTIADAGNNRVLIYGPHIVNNGPPAGYVMGQNIFTADSANGGGAIGASGLHSPRGVQYDSAGNLWVSDSSNNRLLMFPYDESIRWFRRGRT